MKLSKEDVVTIQQLSKHEHSGRQIAALLGVCEGTVRYHLRRRAEGATDGRAEQKQLAQGWGEQIRHYVKSRTEKPDEESAINMADLYDWLVSEHRYSGSLRSVQRFYRRHYPAPKKRARRRVETPPGAQAQADWSEWPRLWIGGRCQYAYQFHLKLSFSRFSVKVWSPRKDQLSWLHVHNEAFRRLQGVPAVVRVDNEKTAVSSGAGSWGEINPSYRRYAATVRFHIDACQPSSPEAKGKVERDVRTDRGDGDVTGRHWDTWDQLQAYSDEKALQRAARAICPATGETVQQSWQKERAFLASVPVLPEPFDLAVTRMVAPDCTVGFEGRRYSVPFHLLGRRVEVHGCARTVQVYADGAIVASHLRQSRERILIDPAHFEGEATSTVLPPLPLGRMGQRLQQIAALAPQQRPLDLYAALAEVAR